MGGEDRPEGLAMLVRMWRGRALLTQEQLADRAGVSVGTVRGVESGRIQRPRGESVRLLADGLGLSAAERAELVATARGEDEPPVEPGPQPQPAARAVPAQLPADLSGFTGRGSYLRELDELVASDPEGDGTAVVISAIAGMAGVGKTALALHWAHRVRDQFPDGQLYVNLRGYSAAQPMRPVEALSGFLLGLGVPAEQVPADLEHAEAMFRSRLSGKRVLVVLDNAASAQQVRPLLPGAAGCLVVLTSRDRLSGLVASHSAHRINLDVLTPPEARALLVAVLGADRAAADVEAVAALARCCGYLPLALRIAAAQLLDQPDRPIADLVAELERDQLSTLEVPGDEQNAVRVAFDLSYAALPAQARRVFRLLGLVPGPDVTVEAVAALADKDEQETQRLLNRLVASHLITVQAGRYTLHDLLRQYAAGRAVAEDGRDAGELALGRLYDWYLASTGRCADLLYSEMMRLEVPPSHQQPARQCAMSSDGAKTWLLAEQANLIAAIRHTASAGPHRAAWLLADVLRGFFYHGRYTVHWFDAASAGLAAAEADGDDRAAAAMHLNLASAHKCLEHWDLTVHHLTLSRELAQKTGWNDAAIRVASNLLSLRCDLGDIPEVRAQMVALLEQAEQAADWVSAASLLVTVGWAHRESGLLADAERYIMRSLAMQREVGHDALVGTELNNLGVVCHDLGRLDEAYERLTAAIAIHARFGRRGSEAESRQHLALLLNDLGKKDEAVRQAEAAMRLTEDTRQRRIQAGAHNVLGTIRLGQRLPEHAVTHHRTALALANTPNGRPRVDALVGLAAALRDLGRREEAADHAEQALEISRRAGYRSVEGQAVAARASIQLATGQQRQALETAEQALAIFKETQYRLGAARVLILLGEIHAEAGGTAEVAGCWRAANKIFTRSGAAQRAPTLPRRPARSTAA